MKRLLATLVKLVVFACLATAAVLFYLDWRIPRATATVQVHPLQLCIPPGGVLHRSYMESEFETIESEETLNMAANALGIENGHRRKALILMKKNMEAKPLRGTDFIEITVKDQDPAQAVKIANAIAEAYAQRRASAESDRFKRALEALDGELLAQEELVNDYRKDLEFFLTEYNLEFPADNQTFPKPDDLPHDEIGGTVDLSLQQHTYNQAVETFTQSHAMLREMKIKQEEVRILLNGAPPQPITIHKVAK